MNRSRTKPSSRSPAAALPAARPGERLAVWLVALALVVSTALVYVPVAGYPFIETFDDGVTVTQNAHVTGGLTAENVRWAFTGVCDGSWQPLTMLSHMFVCGLFGLAPGAHHLANLLLHVLDAVLLFLVLRKATARTWPGAFVAGLFALHPLHVESVAWVTERKDVLSTLFLLLAIGAWVRHVRGEGRGNHALALAAMAAGLMCKPMLVTLPFVLVLLEWWPLGRLAGAPAAAAATPARISLAASLREKLPMLALAAGSILVTLWAQRSAGALALNARVPLATRLAGAALAAVTYAAKLVVPRHLAFFYPWPSPMPWAAALAAALALAAVSVAAFALRRRWPQVFVGWFWYLGTLVPVLGIVQTGSHAMADRFTYVPAIGLALALAFGVAAVLPGGRVSRALAWGAGLAALLALALVSARQLRYWSEPALLFRHGFEVTEGNFVAHNNYAVEVYRRGHVDEARVHLEQAVRLNRGYTDGWSNLAMLLRETGRPEQSLATLQRAVGNLPGDHRLQYELALTLAVQGNYPAAFPHFEIALAAAPADTLARSAYSNALSNWGAELARSGFQRNAAGFYQRALRVNPANEVARQNLALVPADSLASPR